MTEQLKRTPLAEEHVKLGARMVDFGGWYMPVQYEGVVPEHEAVRERVGLFDVSHMGEIRVSGAGAEAFLDSITTNDVTKLVDYQAHYTILTTERGTVIDDLLIYRHGPDNFLLVVNASTQDKDLAWIEKHAAGRDDVVVASESDATGQIAIQGPLAEQVLQRLTETNLADIAYYRFTLGQVSGIDALISRTGYTGEDGFECYIPAEKTAELWNKLLEAGRDEDIKPAGLGARDSLRLEARMHLYGQDMDEDTTVLEAGLSWACKLKKASDFVGKDALKAQRKAGVEKKLVGFELLDKGIARNGYPVMDGEQQIGVVTSGTKPPTVKKSIGLAYVPKEVAVIDNIIHIQVRKKLVQARIVKGPFYKRS